MLQSKVIYDLELRDHGLAIHAVDPYLFQPFPDGEYVLIWKDHERTADEIRRISRRDGDRFGDWTAFWERAAGIIYRYFLSEPPTLAELAAQVSGTPDEPVFERMLTGNVKDLVEEHFESELVRAAFIDAQDAGDPAATGSLMSVAYFECNLFTDRQNLGIPKGGMGGITQAMAGAATANGVEIRTGVEVERIQIENGRASGVVLATSEEIEADAVVSNADPKRTFLTLVDADALEPGFLAGIRRLKTEVSYLKFHAALDELPDFTPYLRERYDPKYLTHTRICPSVQYFEQSWHDAKHGRPSSCPVMHVQIPSVYETNLHSARPARHVGMVPVRAGTPGRGHVGRRKAACWRASHRHDRSVRPQRAGRHHRLGAVHSQRPGAEGLPDGRQHPAPGHGPPAASGPATEPPAFRLRDPHRGAIPVRRGHPPRRRGHRRTGPQRRPGDSARMGDSLPLIRRGGRLRSNEA